MKKILLLINPIAISACSGGAGLEDAFEYDLGNPVCENGMVTFNDFKVVFNEEPSEHATLIIEIKGIDDYTVVINTLQSNEELNTWYTRNLSFSASPDTCEVYKTTFKWT